MNDVNKQIAISSLWNFLMVLFSRIGGLIFIIIIARYLMPEGFGIYSLAISIALIFLLVIDTGINQSLLRYVAEALGDKNMKLAKANFGHLLKLKLIITLILSITLIILSYPLSIYIFNKPELFLPLMFTSIYLIAYSFGSFYHSYYYVIKKVNYITTRQIIFESVRIFGILMIFTFIARKYHIIGTIGVLAITTLIATLYLIYNLRKLSPYLFEVSNERVEKKRIFKFSIYMGAVGSLLVIFGYIDTIMVGIFLESSYVGFYSAAAGITGGIWSFLNISNILLPAFTQLKDHDLEASFNKVLKYLLILSVPSIFGIFILGKFIITKIFGLDYSPAIIPFYILAILILEVPFISAMTSLFSAKEKPKYIVRIILLATLLNIFLNYVLITYFLKISPEMALAGAAIATVISQTFYLIGLMRYTKKELKIKIHHIHLIKPLVSSIIMVAIIYPINNFLPEGIYSTITTILIAIIIYFTSMYLLNGINRADILLIRRILKRE